MSDVPIAGYLETLFRELERLWPTSGALSHGMAWDEETEALVMLFNVGDFVFVVDPGDLGDDPRATAASLVARGELKVSAASHIPKSAVSGSGEFRATRHGCGLT